MKNVVFCVSGKGSHIPFIKNTISSIKGLNKLYNICLGSYFIDNQMQAFASLNGYQLFYSLQNTDRYVNPLMKFAHHRNVDFPEIILLMSLCKEVYDNTDYLHVIFVHPDMYIDYDFLPLILLLNNQLNIYNTRLLTTYPYNNYLLIKYETPEKLLFITSDSAIVSGYRLNQPISLWKKAFLDKMINLHGSWLNVYRLFLYTLSLCCDVAMFNFNRKINKNYELMCNFLNVHKIVENRVLSLKISHLTFLNTRVGY